VKYPRIEVHPDVIKIIVPKNYSREIEDLIHRHERWIEERLKRLKGIKMISEDLILYNQKNLKDIVENRINEYSEILGAKPEKTSFRKMKNRWGSCKYKGGQLIFSKDLKFLPEELINYVVLHEMCHLIVRNHGKEFWNLVGKIDDKYKEKERFLMSYRFKLNQLKKGG
jgi:predicted metal-dependent hydrolase